MAVNMIKGKPVSFDKQEAGLMTVELNWENPHVDIDLDCIIEMADSPGPYYNFAQMKRYETKIIILQNLSQVRGRIGRVPFVTLSGDARVGGTGAEEGKEVLTFNLARSNRISRALVYAWNYTTGSLKSAGNARVTVHHPTLGDYYFDFNNVKEQTAVLLDIRCDAHGNLTLNRLDHFTNDTQTGIDAYYQWPRIDWKPTTK